MAKYIDCLQAIVTQWFSLHPLLELCARDTVFEGVGRTRLLYWRQVPTEEVLRKNLEELPMEGRQGRWTMGRAEDGWE